MKNMVVLCSMVLLIPLTADADPVDTAMDLLQAFEYADGYALEQLLSEDLYGTLEGFMAQMRQLAETDPVLAGNLLASRYGSVVDVEDLEFLSDPEIIGLVMGQISLQSSEMIESESVSMEGRNATVVLTYFNGASISFQMVWENSSWRVSGSSLLTTLFN